MAYDEDGQSLKLSAAERGVYALAPTNTGGKVAVFDPHTRSSGDRYVLHDNVCALGR